MGAEIENGKGFCPLEGKDNKELVDAIEKVNETHQLLSALVQHTSHLQVISKLNEESRAYLINIARSNDEIRTYLMGAATSKNHVPLEVMTRVVKMEGFIILGLMFIIVFLLTGAHAGWINALHQ